MSFFFLLFLLLFASCDDLEDTDTPSGGDGGMPAETGTAELYILSEGLFNLNNSSLALYSFKNNQLNTDYFRSINRRGLGIPPMTWAFMEANSISWSMYRAR